MKTQYISQCSVIPWGSVGLHVSRGMLVNAFDDRAHGTYENRRLRTHNGTGREKVFYLTRTYKVCIQIKTEPHGAELKWTDGRTGWDAVLVEGSV